MKKNITFTQDGWVYLDIADAVWRMREDQFWSNENIHLAGILNRAEYLLNNTNLWEHDSCWHD